MKKYYGPIVLGITAMTVAAPVVKTTTVMAADEQTANTEGNKDETTPVDLTKVPLEIKTNIDSLPTITQNVDISKATSDSDITIDLDSSLYSGYTADTKQITAHVSQDGQSITTDDTLNLTPIKTDTGIKLSAKGIVVATGEKIDFNSTNLDISPSKDNYVNLMALDGFNFVNTKDNSTTNIIHTTHDDSGEITVPAEYLDKNGNVTLVDNLSAKELKEEISSNIAHSAHLTSPNNQKGLDELNENMKNDLNAIKFPKDGDTPTSAELRSISQQIKDVMSKYTTPLHLSDTSIEPSFPILKDSNIMLPQFNNGEYAMVSLDKDGNLTAIEITDKNGKPVKSNTALDAWIGGIFDDKPAKTITNHNEKLPSTNTNHHNNSNNNTNKPAKDAEPTPKPAKTFVDHKTTFYALPNKYTNLYNENGDILTTRALDGNTTWYSDELMTLDGVSFLRVATGEFAKLSTGLEVSLLSENVVTKNQARLFTADGQAVTNRALAKNSAWHTDKSATINGETMYRVATNEWVRVADVY